MSEDISAMIRVGVTLILVAALVSAILNLMVVAQTTLNSGMATLQAGVSQISLQEFQNYNQKTISGTEVASALTLFDGRDIAIVVSTKGMQGSSASAAASTYPAVNYGAVIKAATGVTTAGIGSVGTDYITSVTPGQSKYMAEFNLNTAGSVQTNSNLGNVSKKGNPEYINPTGKFKCNLIYDSSDQIIGFVAIQESKTAATTSGGSGS